MIGVQVTSLIETSLARLDTVRPDSIDAVRGEGESLIAFDEATRGRMHELKRFLTRNLYQHPRVTAMTQRAERTVTALFDAYVNEPAARPAKLCEALDAESAGVDPARLIADYIAGMTDRYAIAEYERIFGSAEPT
jgi:dGTPase